MDEAWLLTEDPARMQQSADAAIAELRRADELVTGEPLSDAARVDLTAARQEVEDLARHTRLLVAGTANLWQFADEVSGEKRRQAEDDFCTRQREAFARFGLDPLTEPAEEVARTVASSRLRDALLGMLLEWWYRAADTGAKGRLKQVVSAIRRLSGGAYARWQDLLDRTDVKGLVAFAASPDGLTFRASLVVALSRDLTATGQFPACLTYLRAATDRYPRDPWLHLLLFQTCREIGPTASHEALRHIAAACVLRPDSAMFHLLLGACYSTLRAYDLAVPAYHRSIALYPNSALAYQALALDLAKVQDEKGAIAAFKEAAVRLSGDQPRAILYHAMGLVALGRPAEAVREYVHTFSRFPSWADDPRLQLRYGAAQAAMSCADGKGSPPVSLAERRTYRKQALDLLVTELTSLAKLAASDKPYVDALLRQWLNDSNFESIRPPKTAVLPPDERTGWEEFWARVKSLRDSTDPSVRSESP
jgi:tetratricopeptide (TPR) repeat protein